MKKIALIVSVATGICAVAAVIAIVASQDATTIDLYYYKSEISDGIDELVKAFSEKYPGINIKTETFPNNSLVRLRARLFSGDAPDIIQLQSYAQVFEFARAGYLSDLSGEPVISGVDEKYLEAVTEPASGKIYALPMDFSGMGVFYNKTIFEECGIKPPHTYSDLVRVCNELKNRRIVPFTGMLQWSAGQIMTMLHASLAGSNEVVEKWIVQMNAGKASWANPVNVKKLFDIMDFYRDNLDSQSLQKDDITQAGMFKDRKAAMMIQGLWVGVLLDTAPKLDWGFIPFPVSENPAESKFYADVDSTFAISATSGERERNAALRFLAWLSTKEAIALWTDQCRLIPVFKDADKSTLPAPFLVFLTHCERYGSYDWEYNKYPLSTYEDAIKNGASGYFLGQRSKEDVVTYIDDSWRIAIR